MGLVRHNFGGQDPSEKAVWRTDPGNFSSGNFLFRILLIWKDKGTGDRPFSEGLWENKARYFRRLKALLWIDSGFSRTHQVEFPHGVDPNSRGELEVNGTYQNCFPVLIQFCLRGKGESFVKEYKIWRLCVFSYRSHLAFNKILLDMPRYRTITWDRRLLKRVSQVIQILELEAQGAKVTVTSMSPNRRKSWAKQLRRWRISPKS